MKKRGIGKMSNKEKILLKILMILAITGNIAYGENLEVKPDSNGGYIAEQNDNLHLGETDKQGIIHTKGDGKKHTYKFNQNVIVDGRELSGNSENGVIENKGMDDIDISLEENKVLTIKSLERTGIAFSSKDTSDRKTLNINDENNKHGDIFIENIATGHGSYKGSAFILKNADANIYAKNLSIKGNELSGSAIVVNKGNLNIGLSGDFYSAGDSSIFVRDGSKVNIETEKDFIIDSRYATNLVNGIDISVSSGSELTINADNNIKIFSKNTIFQNYMNMGNIKEKVNLNAKNIYLKSVDRFNMGYHRIFDVSTVNINFKAEDIVLEGANSTSYISNNSTLNLDSKNLYLSKENFTIRNNSKVNFDIKENISVEESNFYSSNSEIISKADTSSFKNSDFTAIDNGKIIFDSNKNIIAYSKNENVDNELSKIRATNNGVISFTSNKNIIEGKIEVESNGKVEINFDGDFDGNQKSSLLGIAQLSDDHGKRKDGEINLGFSNGAVWNIFNDNPYNKKLTEVTNLTFNKGIINLSYENKDRKIESAAYDLVVDNLKGNYGTFIVGVSSEDINHEKPLIPIPMAPPGYVTTNPDKKSNFIEIKKAEGQQTHYIQIADNSIDEIKNHDFEEGKKAIWIADADKNVNFEGKAFESLSNIYDYTVILDKNLVFDDRNHTSENGNNWYITNVDRSKNEVGNSVNRDLSFLYEAAISRLEVDSIHERLGEVRNYDKPHGVWFRTTAGDIKSDDFKNEYNLIQVGYDKQNNVKNGRTFTGFAFNQRKNKLSFDSGDGNSENLGFTVYKSYVADNGLYVDALAKTTYIDTEYKISNDTETMKADYNTWAETVSLEIGKKYSNKEDNSFIIPHAQLNYSFIKGEDYTTSTDIKVKQNDINSLIGKVGIYAGKDFGNSTHYLKAARLYEFSGDYGMTLADKHDSYSEKTNGEESWTELGIGGTFQVGKSGDVHMYYSLDRTLGSRYEKQWEGTIGIRVTF